MAIFGKDNYFYAGQTKQAIRLFASVFADLYIKRGDDFIPVPLLPGYGHQSERTGQSIGERETKKVGAVLPAMSFRFGPPERDTGRSTQAYVDLSAYPDNGTEDGGPTIRGADPRNISFTLTTRTKLLGDDLQIMEQILAVFQPNVTFDMKAFEGTGVPNHSHRVTIELVDVGDLPMMDTIETPDERFAYERQYDFVLRTFVYARLINTHHIKEVAIRASVDDVVLGVTSVIDYAAVADSEAIGGVIIGGRV